MENAVIAKIKAEIERLYNGEAPKHDQQCNFDDGYFTGIDAIAQFIDTLESEKPMNQEGLEKEIDRVWKQCNPIDEGMGVESTYMHIEAFNIVARHFYDLGCHRTAEKYDEIEYNRQRAEESVPNGLEEAAGRYQESAFVDTTIHYCGADEDVYFANRIVDAFKAGAKWQAEQLLKSSPLPEDTVLFNKGVAEGRRLAEEEQADLFTIVALDAAQRAKEQMMQEAVEGEVVQDLKGVNRVKSFSKIPEGLHFGDKVRIIVCKNED